MLGNTNKKGRRSNIKLFHARKKTFFIFFSDFLRGNTLLFGSVDNFIFESGGNLSQEKGGKVKEEEKKKKKKKKKPSISVTPITCQTLIPNICKHLTKISIET